MADGRVAGEHINMKASNYLNMLKQNATNKQEFLDSFSFSLNETGKMQILIF